MNVTDDDDDYDDDDDDDDDDILANIKRTLKFCGKYYHVVCCIHSQSILNIRQVVKYLQDLCYLAYFLAGF